MKNAGSGSRVAHDHGPLEKVPHPLAASLGAVLSILPARSRPRFVPLELAITENPSSLSPPSCDEAPSRGVSVPLPLEMLRLLLLLFLLLLLLLLLALQFC